MKLWQMLPWNLVSVRKFFGPKLNSFSSLSPSVSVIAQSAGNRREADPEKQGEYNIMKS